MSCFPWKNHAEHHNKGYTGQRISEGNKSMLNHLDKQSFDKAAESAGTQLWKGFVIFASASAGILYCYIHNCMANQTNHRWKHIRICHALYLLIRYSSPSRNMDSVTHLFCHLGKTIKIRQRDGNESNNLKLFRWPKL